MGTAASIVMTADQQNEYAEMVRSSRIEVIHIDRIQVTATDGELVFFTSEYPNASITHRIAYVKHGNKVWNMILD